MADIIFSLKNVVIIILASEFMKRFMDGTKYKKYISFALSLVVIGFLISAVTGANFDFLEPPDFNYTESISSENLIITEYKKKISEKIIEKFPKDKMPEPEIDIDDKYNIVNIRIKTDYENAGKILEELGFTNYEIID